MLQIAYVKCWKMAWEKAKYFLLVDSIRKIAAEILKPSLKCCLTGISLQHVLALACDFKDLINSVKNSAALY